MSVPSRAFVTLVALALFILGAGVVEARMITELSGISRGTILIRTDERKLYYGIGFGRAIEYPIGVGRQGRQWTGKRYISGKTLKPAWRATPDIRRDKPHLTSIIPGGSPKNPMGAAALLISGPGQYAIHGTNDPNSIGRFVSYGCIRMHNEDILDLYSRVFYGTRIIVTR